MKNEASCEWQVKRNSTEKENEKSKKELVGFGLTVDRARLTVKRLALDETNIVMCTSGLFTFFMLCQTQTAVRFLQVCR